MPVILPRLAFTLDNMPEIGARIAIDRKARVGRCEERERLAVHTLADWKERNRRDGAKSALLVWRSECGECSATFEQVTGLEFKGFMRRCDACRKAAPRLWAGFPSGPRNRYVLFTLGEVDPLSLF